MQLVASAFLPSYQLASFPVPEHFTAKCSRSYSALTPSLKTMPLLPAPGSYKGDISLPASSNRP